MDNTARYRVLLVDDERLVRFTISSYLRKSNFEVIESASPQEAIAHVKRTRFDAIISDVVMGEIDGFAFRDMVRQITSSVPIIFLTSMVNDYGNWLLEKISEDVRSYFLAKGISRELMQFRIRSIIGSYMKERESERINREFETGLEMASYVQRSLLPQWADIDRKYHYGIAWRPFEAVSGDLYEWIRIGSDKALLIFGDVSGHGIRSSLAMTAIQSFLKRFQDSDERRASRVHAIAHSIHDFIDANLRGIIYMAGFVAYIDFGNNSIRFINAGLPEMLCVRADSGEFLPLNPEGRGAMPFGLIHDAQYTDDDVVEVSFPDDAVFLLATDGVTDCSSDSEGNNFVPDDIFREVCSLAVTSDYANGTVMQTSSIILKALDELGYAHPQDDRAMIAFCKAHNRPDCLAHEVRIAPRDIDLMAETMGMYAANLTGNDELSMKVQLLLDEFLMNVHRHGFDGNGNHNEYGVVMGMVVNGQFELTVWERGQDWHELSSMSIEETQQKLDERNEMMASSGRGTAIMRLIADSGVRHERVSNLNKTVFRIPIESKASVGKEQE